MIWWNSWQNIRHLFNDFKESCFARCICGTDHNIPVMSPSHSLSHGVTLTYPVSHITRSPSQSLCREFLHAECEFSLEVWGWHYLMRKQGICYVGLQVRGLASSRWNEAESENCEEGNILKHILLCSIRWKIVIAVCSKFSNRLWQAGLSLIFLRSGAFMSIGVKAAL